MTRIWFQIHLSTLMLSVLWCAIMQLLSHKGLNLSGVKRMPDGWVCVQQGFPFRSFEEIRGTINGERFITASSYPENIVIDLFFWIASVFALGFVLETRIRRREARKP